MAVYATKLDRLVRIEIPDRFIIDTDGHRLDIIDQMSWRSASKNHDDHLI